MQVAQVVQCCFVFVAHSARKVRIAQAPVARGLRHILQHAKLLLNHLLALPRNLSPLRQHIILDMLALLRRHPAPGIFFRAQICPLLPIQVVPLVELLPDTALLLWSKILKCFAVLQHTVALLGCEVAHAVHKRTRGAHSGLLSGPQRCSWPVFIRPVAEIVRIAEIIRTSRYIRRRRGPILIPVGRPVHFIVQLALVVRLTF